MAKQFASYSNYYVLKNNVSYFLAIDSMLLLMFWNIYKASYFMLLLMS